MVERNGVEPERCVVAKALVPWDGVGYLCVRVELRYEHHMIDARER